MQTRRRSYRSAWLFRLVGIWFAVAQVLALTTPRWATAQTSGDPWAVPENLSHSGAANNPVIVIDSNGIVHVVWEDDFANYVYTQLKDGQWSLPQRTDLHRLFGSPISQEETGQSQAPLFSGPNPLFIAGPGRYIFAFWIAPEGELYVSRVLNDDFMDVTRWDGKQLLSPSAASFSVVVDASGELHLAYMRTVDDPENPAGIYYLGSRNNGLDWGLPELLYESSYLRRLGEGEANLSLATAGTADAPIVYVAWDNRPRRQLFLAKSADGGASWDQPMQVAGPAPDSGSASPFNVHVGAIENNAVLVWQSGPPGGPCNKYFQSSVDAGATWSEARTMFEDLTGCAQTNEFVMGLSASPGGFLYLLTNVQDQIFLSAWNGSQWSQPQAQPILSSFEDLEIYTQVAFGCHRAALFGEVLYIVGCDREAGGDIWITSRNNLSTASWFLPQLWSQPAPMTSDNLDLAAVEMVATGDGLIHVCFSRHRDTGIYYLRWDGTSWSRITSILKLPDGEAGWPAIAAGPDDKLFLIALSSRGSLYFSRANSREAVSESRWSAPARLRIIHDGKVSSADVVWDAAGTVHVAYSVLINEERGVYLIQSEDEGKTWSAPVQVFDGAAAGFDLIGPPSMLASVDGSLHILWNHQSIQVDGVSQPLSLHYARSLDAGQTFNEAELVVEAPVTWRDLVADGKGNLHRFWQRSDMMTTLWDQVSIDGGQTWQVAQQLPAEWGSVKVTIDPAGRLHLLGAGLGPLEHWIWDGSRWQEEEPVHWMPALQQEDPMELMASAISKQGELVVVLGKPAGEGQAAGRLLLYATRTLDLPSLQTPNQIIQPQSPPSPTYSPATPPPELSLAPATPIASESTRPQGTIGRTTTSDPMDPFAIALIPVALLHLSLMGILVLRAARPKAR